MPATGSSGKGSSRVEGHPNLLKGWQEDHHRERSLRSRRGTGEPITEAERRLDLMEFQYRIRGFDEEGQPKMKVDHREARRLMELFVSRNTYANSRQRQVLLELVKLMGHDPRKPSYGRTGKYTPKRSTLAERLGVDGTRPIHDALHAARKKGLIDWQTKTKSFVVKGVKQRRTYVMDYWLCCGSLAAFRCSLTS